MINISKQIGCIFLIIGTSLGGGILAIPILLSHFGVLIGCTIMFGVWLLMTYSTLAIAEACQHFERGISFLGLAHKLFGKFGIILVYICAFGILYGMLTAYISAIGSTFEKLFHLNHIIVELIFVAIFGFFILKGTDYAEWLNRICLSIKLVIIMTAISMLFFTVKLDNLTLFNFGSPDQLIIILPILATTFSAHIITPTIVSYVGYNLKIIKRIIMIASLIILAIYISWIITIFGNIAIYGDKHSFLSYLENTTTNDSVKQLFEILKLNISNTTVLNLIYTFITISVSTAFITLSLALKDLILDKFPMKKAHMINKNLILIFLLFLLPIIINYYFEQLFLIALSVVGLFSLIMLVTCPLNMVRIMRKQNYILIYASMKNTILNTFAITITVLIIFLQLLSYLV